METINLRKILSLNELNKYRLSPYIRTTTLYTFKSVGNGGVKRKTQFFKKL